MLIFWTILLFIFFLSFIFFTHELGHFLAARKVGVPVLEFGFGFPPRLFGWKKGETLYSINLIPFGAFVNILGLDNPKNKDPRSYWQQSVGRRFLIASSGILANFFWAWFILTISLWLYLFIPVKNFIIIQEVIKNSPAASAGLKQGDLIIKADGKIFTNSEEISQFTKSHQEQEVVITVLRLGKTIEKKIKLSNNEAPLGVSMLDVGGAEKTPFWKAPLVAAKTLVYAIYQTTVYLGKLILRPFLAEKVPFELGGPIMIWGVVSQFYALGFLYLFRLAALLSLGLGFFNLLPLPAIDGGRMSFLILEKIFGKKIIRPEVENTIHGVGFILLIGFSILIAYKDVLRLLGR